MAIVFFNILCPKSVQLMLPRIQRYQKEIGGFNSANCIGIHSSYEDQGSISEQAVRIFVRNHKLKFPVGIDKGTGFGYPESMRNFAVEHTPALIICSAAGRVDEILESSEAELAVFMDRATWPQQSII